MLKSDEKIWLETCISETEKLNEWENAFIEDLYDKQDNKHELTLNQRNKLRTIYDKIV